MNPEEICCSCSYAFKSHPASGKCPRSPEQALAGIESKTFFADNDTSCSNCKHRSGMHHYTDTARASWPLICPDENGDQVEVPVTYFLDARFAQTSRKHVNGCTCTCGFRNEYAQPNQKDGSYKCFNCRS